MAEVFERPEPADPAESLRESRKATAEAIKEHREAASGVIRQLAYAGIALAWMFRLDRADGPALPHQVVLPLFLLGLTLALDLLQHLTGMALGYFRLDTTERGQLGAVRATILGMVHRYRPLPLLFAAKALALMAAYAVLLTTSRSVCRRCKRTALQPATIRVILAESRSDSRCPAPPRMSPWQPRTSCLM
jgi:hypothetical protein